MGSFTDNAFPAGDESDGSNDEWDIGCPDKKSPRIKVTSENVLYLFSIMFMLVNVTNTSANVRS